MESCQLTSVITNCACICGPFTVLIFSMCEKTTCYGYGPSTHLLVRKPFQETYILVVIRDLELFRLDALQLESSEMSHVMTQFIFGA